MPDVAKTSGITSAIGVLLARQCAIRDLVVLIQVFFYVAVQSVAGLVSYTFAVAFKGGPHEVNSHNAAHARPHYTAHFLQPLPVNICTRSSHLYQVSLRCSFRIGLHLCPCTLSRVDLT